MIPTQLLPEQYRQSWCVAGGFAACPALARDIDVWVYGISTDALDSARQTILDHLETGKTVSATRRRLLYVVEPGVETRTQATYCQEFINIKKVATVYGHSGWYLDKVQPVHITVTDAPGGPGSIIAGFDISTHAVAVDWNGRVWTNEYTHPGEQPIRLPASNEYTEPRMERICARFGHTYLPKELSLAETIDE